MPTVDVPHLGGITAGYRLSNGALDPAKPTVVLVNAMCTTTALYEPQFASARLADAVNLLAVEPLGHGDTALRGGEQFTAWDSATMVLQVMTALGVERAFALGTSMGGWIVTRMALLAPDRILGLLPLGTSMDYESNAARAIGSWDPEPVLSPFHEAWSVPTPAGQPEFVPDKPWRDMVATIGFGSISTPESLAFWDTTLRRVYRGEAGRRKLRMALVNLLWRDGLLPRLRDVRCPVHWLHGLDDTAFRPELALAHIKYFTSSPEAKLTLIEKGNHYLNATNPEETEDAILEMVRKHGRKSTNS